MNHAITIVSFALSAFSGWVAYRNYKSTPPPPAKPEVTEGEYTILLSTLAKTGKTRWQVTSYDNTLGEGVQDSREMAKAAADAFAEALASDPPIERYGLQIAKPGCEIHVTDADTWIAWAAPRMEAAAKQISDPIAIVRGLLEELAPECDWSADLQELQDRTTATWDAGLNLAFQATPPPLADNEPTYIERAAAAMVGTIASPHAPPGFVFRGYAIAITPHPSLGYRWFAHRDDELMRSGGAPTAEGAVAAAKSTLSP